MGLKEYIPHPAINQSLPSYNIDRSIKAVERNMYN
jgi:hypothetical protein